MNLIWSLASYRTVLTLISLGPKKIIPETLLAENTLTYISRIQMKPELENVFLHTFN